MENILNYFKTKGIELKTGSKLWLNELNEYSIGYLEYAINNLTHIRGIERHLSFLTSIEIIDDISERELYNTLCEIHAYYFIEIYLKYTVENVEIPNVNNIISPHCQNAKSCDLIAKYEGELHYFEVKNSSTQITSRFDYEGYRAYTPATRPYIGQWIIWKLEEAFEKGATDLFATVPFWYRPDDNPDEYFFNGWIDEVFSHYFKITKTGKNTFLLENGIRVPDFFNKLFIPKRSEFIECKINL